LSHGEEIPPAQVPPQREPLHTMVEFEQQDGKLKTKPARLSHPDGRTSFLVEGKVVRRVDRENKQVGARLVHPADVTCVAVSRDGAKLATGAGSEIRCWDLRDGTLIAGPYKLAHAPRFLSFHPDGERLVFTTDPDNDLYAHAFVWALDSGPAAERFARVYPRSPLFFSPDGRRLLGRSSRDDVRMWDGRTGRPLGVPVEHGGQIDSFSFSPDGLAIVTSGLETARHPLRPSRGDGRIRLWDTGTGKPLCPLLKVEKGGNIQTWFSADGKQLYGGHRVLIFSEKGPRSEWCARRWCAPGAVQGEPKRIRLWVEMMTGLALDNGGAVVRLSAEEWQDRRDRLAALGGPPR
jgi:WD40 repeat protein